MVPTFCPFSGHNSRTWWAPLDVLSAWHPGWATRGTRREVARGAKGVTGAKGAKEAKGAKGAKGAKEAKGTKSAKEANGARGPAR